MGGLEPSDERCEMKPGNGSHDIAAVLERLGIAEWNSGACWGEWIRQPSGGELVSVNPADGSAIARVHMASERDYDEVVGHAVETFQQWRLFPAPKRGQIIREIGDELRGRKDDLGTLVTLEMGKILAEGKGEVQEMIDIADFAVGLSRQLYGFTMQSERPGHRMYEQWHPLGVAGVISAFNFPVAVWSWNAFIAAVLQSGHRPRSGGGRDAASRPAAAAGERHRLLPHGLPGGRGGEPAPRPSAA